MGPRRNDKKQGHASRCCWVLVVGCWLLSLLSLSLMWLLFLLPLWLLGGGCRFVVFACWFCVVGVGGCSPHSVPNRPQIDPGTLQNGSQGPPEGQNDAQGLPGGHLEAQVAPRWAPEVPKRRSSDSSRRPLGSPRDVFGSILVAKMESKSCVGDFMKS